MRLEAELYNLQCGVGYKQKNDWFNYDLYQAWGDKSSALYSLEGFEYYVLCIYSKVRYIKKI